MTINDASEHVSVRAARFDRPMRALAIDPNYSDAHLEELVRVAAERARETARAEGYAAGWSQGRQAAGKQAQAESLAVAGQIAAQRTAVGRQLQQLLTALAEATVAARQVMAPDWIEVADVLASGALHLAASALGRELQSVDGQVAEAVASALRQLAEPGEAVVHLNPAEADLVDPIAAGVRVIADPEIAPGTVTVLTPAQRLRHDLPAALAAAEEVLRA
jgi:flagellar assembly protein FliH